MHRTIVALTTGAVLAFAGILSVHDASAHGERCVCTSTTEVPPVPPVPPVPSVAPLPPLPPHHADAGRHVQTKIVILRPDGSRQVRIVSGDGMHSLHGLRRVIHIEEHGDGRITRGEFMNRASRAFEEHDKNHDGVIDDKDAKDDVSDNDDDDDEIDVPEPPEAPEALDDEDEAPEAPEPPAPPHPPHPPHAPHAPHD